MSKVIRWIPDIKGPYTLYLVIRDPRTRRYSKIWAIAIIGLMVAYVLSPLDIIPDAIPVLGWMDDLLLVPIAFHFIQKILPQDILVENRKIAGRRVNRAILIAVFSILAFLIMWGLIITVSILLIINLIRG
jgi:uncharacterized membrane protein YkvA (DUF1232 family)